MKQEIQLGAAMRSLALSGAGIALVGAAIVLLLQGLWGSPRSVMQVPPVEAPAEAP